MTDTSGLAVALSGPDPSRLLRLGIVEAVNDTDLPPTLMVNSRPMRFVNRVPVGQTALYVDEGQDPVVLGKLSDGDDGMPIGGVIMFAGQGAPPGYLLCWGQSTSGYPLLQAMMSTVPDLRDRFVLGEGGGLSGGTGMRGTGGSKTHAHTQPEHAHTIAHTHTAPGHKHSLGTLDDTTSGTHSHEAEYGGRFVQDTAGPNAGITTGAGSYSIGYMKLAGGHNHTPTGEVGNTARSTGNNDLTTGGSSTGITGQDGGQATGGTDGRPPYYALAYCIRAY